MSAVEVGTDISTVGLHFRFNLASLAIVHTRSRAIWRIGLNLFARVFDQCIGRRMVSFANGLILKWSRACKLGSPSPSPHSRLPRSLPCSFRVDNFFCSV